MPAFAVKYVAVVETDIDVRSGAAAEITPAEVTLITAELRREAVKNLPRGTYNVMTTETVMAQGSATLIECHEENCVIALGSKIGADYIVRGTISKFQTLFTLTVDIYETEDGNLVASSDPVRSENIRGLLENAAPACAEMYRGFASSQPQPPAPAPEPVAAPTPEPVVKRPEPSPKYNPSLLSAGGGAFYEGGFGGGLAWDGGARVAMPYSGGGVGLFFDVKYAEASAGLSTGGGKWESGNATYDVGLPDMSLTYLNIGVFAKYPAAIGNITLFPLLGFDYEALISGKLIYPDGTEKTLEHSTGAAWFKLGCGADVGLGEKAYLRAEMLYGWRAANEYETWLVESKREYDGNTEVTASGGTGLTLKAGVGVRF
jgi:hypothetical protein